MPEIKDVRNKKEKTDLSPQVRKKLDLNVSKGIRNNNQTEP